MFSKSLPETLKISLSATCMFMIATALIAAPTPDIDELSQINERLNSGNAEIQSQPGQFQHQFQQQAASRSIQGQIQAQPQQFQAQGKGQTANKSAQGKVKVQPNQVQTQGKGQTANKSAQGKVKVQPNQVQAQAQGQTANKSAQGQVKLPKGQLKKRAQQAEHADVAGMLLSDFAKMFE